MGGKPVHLRFEYDALGRRTAKISVWGEAFSTVSHASCGMEMFLCTNGRMKVANHPRPNSRRRDITTIPRESHKPN